LHGLVVAVGAQERRAHSSVDGAGVEGSTAQSLLHFVGQGDWSDEAVMERIRAQAIPNIEVHGAISAWIIDDTVNKVWRLPCLVLMSWMQAGSPGFVRHP
jgi:SRSO17 transposase